MSIVRKLTTTGKKQKSGETPRRDEGWKRESVDNTLDRRQSANIRENRELFIPFLSVGPFDWSSVSLSVLYVCLLLCVLHCLYFVDFFCFMCYECNVC